MARPRSTDAHARILDATNALLEECTVADLCIEEIADRARVGKQTIYKWWGGKRALAMEAVLSSLQHHVPATDTGNLEKDLLAFLRRSGRVLRDTSTGRTLASLMAEAQSDPDFRAAFREQFLEVRRKALLELLEAGVARGQLRKRLDLDLVLDALFGAYWYRLLTRRAPIDDRFAEELVGLLLPGIAVRPKRKAA